MASMWEIHLDSVLSIIRTSRTRADVAHRCSLLLGKPVTDNAVSAALRRLRRDKGYEIPLIEEILNTSGLQDTASIENCSFTSSGDLFKWAAMDSLDDLGDTMVKLIKPKKGFDTLPVVKHLGWLPKRIAVIPDSHHPNQDNYAIAAMMAYLRDVKPDYIVILGDVLDCLCLSRHPNSHSALKISEIKYLLDAEIKSAKPFINELLSISGGNVSWQEGNHEYRRQNIINSNPGLLGLAAMEPKNFFEIPDDVLWIPGGPEEPERLRIGNMFFEHGDQIINSRGSMHIANTMWNRRPNVNTFVGHWHCIDSKTRVSYTDEGEAVSSICATIGHLSVVKEHNHYAKLPNWTHGFAIIDTWKDEDDKCQFSFDQIAMRNYEFSRNGKLYSGYKLM